MKNEDLPAHPADVVFEPNGSLFKLSGLTKLEYAAIMAMNGILSNGDMSIESVTAYDAIAYAKELLKQLEEK